MHDASIEFNIDIRAKYGSMVLFQTMAATKRSQGVASMLTARQSLNDEELVSVAYKIAKMDTKT